MWLWHRWFDAREHRRALAAMGADLARVNQERVEAVAEAEALRRANARLGARAAGVEHVDDTLAGPQALLDAAKVRIKELERQLDETARVHAVAGRIVRDHAAVSALPPAPNRDREGHYRLEDENARLREQLERCGKEHR